MIEGLASGVAKENFIIHSQSSVLEPFESLQIALLPVESVTHSNVRSSSQRNRGEKEKLNHCSHVDLSGGEPIKIVIL